MKKFFKDLKKYFNYSLYSAKATLKSEVANSYLNWIWWILDPILFMLVYTFVVKVVFDRGGPNFPVFVFIGLTMWNFFSKNINSSVKLVHSNKSIVSKVYLPKYILIIENMMVLAFKMMISFILVLIMLILYKIPFTITMLHMIPLLIVLGIFTFGVSTFLLHFGLFIQDLANIVKITTKLLFYVSGILYSITDRLPQYEVLLLKCNPIAFLASEFRNVIMYNTIPNYPLLLIWTSISIIASILGIKLIQRYENSYVKVI